VYAFRGSPAFSRSASLGLFDVVERTDERVERRELDEATNTGRSDEPYEDETDGGRPELSVSTERRWGWGTDVAMAAAVDGGAPGSV
jgi:hypothetical protein